MTALSAWLAAGAAHGRIASVCGGIYPLAQSGLLDGRQVTTHWASRQMSRNVFAATLSPDAILLRRTFYTSAGVTAGMDLSLALIEEDYGPKLALAVARELVIM